MRRRVWWPCFHRRGRVTWERASFPNPNRGFLRRWYFRFCVRCGRIEFRLGEHGKWKKATVEQRLALFSHLKKVERVAASELSE